MSEIDFIKEIKRTEAFADEIIFNARASKKDTIDKAREEAEKIKEEAKSKAIFEHKAAIEKARELADKVKEDIAEETDGKIAVLKKETANHKDEAIRKITERIVELFGDS